MRFSSILRFALATSCALFAQSKAVNADTFSGVVVKSNKTELVVQSNAETRHFTIDPARQTLVTGIKAGQRVQIKYTIEVEEISQEDGTRSNGQLRNSDGIIDDRAFYEALNSHSASGT